MLEDTVLPVQKCRSKVVCNVYTWLVVTTAFVMFRSETVMAGLSMLKAMFTNFAMDVSSAGFLRESLNSYNICILGTAFLFSYPVSRRVGEKLGHMGKGYHFVLSAGSLILLLLCILNLASTSYNPFIYFRF